MLRKIGSNVAAIKDREHQLCTSRNREKEKKERERGRDMKIKREREGDIERVHDPPPTCISRDVRAVNYERRREEMCLECLPPPFFFSLSLSHGDSGEHLSLRALISDVAFSPLNRYLLHVCCICDLYLC